MLAGERKAGGVVTECALGQVHSRGAFPGGGGMALAAFRAEFSLMYDRIGMAGNASLRRAQKHFAFVAALAFHVSVFTGEREGGHVVVELLEARERGMGAVVLGVAGAALHGIRHFAVQWGMSINLSSHVGVAIEAARGHGRAAPGSGVTGGALAVNLGMGAHAAQLHAVARFGIERAGTEDPPAGGVHDHRHRAEREHADCQAANPPAAHRFRSVISGTWSKTSPRLRERMPG